MSFRQTAAAIQHAKDHTKMGKLSGVNDQVLDQYTRVQVAVTLEQITHILGDESVGRCSLLEMAARTVGTHFSTSAKILGALYSNWRAKLIGMASDGENTMTGRHTGVATRIVACAENKVLRIWCAPHQIDIVVKSSAKGIEDGHWIKFVNAFSVILRSQDNLIISMNVTCPMKTNRWVHLGRLLTACFKP
ncbi:hypothetical protein F441_10359 [Phytophthora nicotianae CJ01A1]|uniref:DUF4371 domain-containing protein n=1 Tax=Phytophthora nicotianae CJ01A1 TaxID=1317063 RepID=W2WYR3_PHYNI|nr:hypothetical protein F441_10359 [Phytophthora nicotianae CJ01A1]